MSQAKLTQKSVIPKHEPRIGRAKQELKTTKDKSKVKNPFSQVDESREKHRSSSLSRRISTKLQDSPRKTQSIDRNHSDRQKATVASGSKDVQRNASKTQNDGRRRIENVIDSDSKYKSSSSRSTSKTESDAKDKTKRNTIPLERKNSIQIAKSFVKSSEAKSKVSKSKKAQKSSSNQASNNSKRNSTEKDSLLERPRTSTIRKGTLNSVSSSLNASSIEKGTKDLKSSRSRSKSSVNGDSENEKSSYEEDFEDYDSDFEESDIDSNSESETTESSESSMEEQELNLHIKDEPLLVKQNLEATVEKTSDNTEKKTVENTFLNLSDRSSLFLENSTSDQQDSKPIKLSRSFINFAVPIEKDPVETEVSEYNIENSFDNKCLDYSQEFSEVTPTPYKYISNLNSNQVFVQTENCEEDEIQTDEIELLNKWTQNPSNGTFGCGGDKEELVNDKSSSWKSLFNVNSTKLSAFIRRSSDIIMTLLDEEFTDFNTNYKIKQRHNFFYSDGYYILSPLSLLSTIPVVNVYSSECSPYILTIHGAMVELANNNDTFNEKGIICVWNTLESKQPEYVLIGNSQPTCGTFGPGGYDIVIAGMTDGAVMLWDLTDLNYSQLPVDMDGPLTLLPPTYNTALILGSEYPSSCVVQIQTVYSHSKKDWRSYSSENRVGTRNFHVLTLEDMGVMKIWVVVEVLKPDISGLESDLGLAPGGKYRLVQSSCIPLYNLSTLQMEQKLSIRTFDFRVVPFDNSRMLVTTDAGIVLHIARHSGGVEPRFYFNEAALSEIRCIDYSPHEENLFLVGCSNGSITLYNVKLVHPIKEFLQGGKGEPVNLVRWSIVHPTVFCVLSSSSHIHLWNIMEDSTQPLHSYHFEDCKITWFVFKRVPSSHFTKGKLSNFIISKENGEVEIHTFQIKNTEKEILQQLDYLQNL